MSGFEIDGESEYDPNDDTLDDELVEEPSVECSRCGKSSPASAERCPFCRAMLGPGGFGASRQKQAAPASPLMRLLGFYIAFLLSTIAWGWVNHFGLKEVELNTPEQVDNYLTQMLVVEAIDTVLVLVAVFAVGRPPRQEPPSPRLRALAWLCAIPLLVLLLGINLGYHEILGELLGLPKTADALVDQAGLSVLLVCVMCVQPAIVEELFFRYLAMGHLRGVMGLHGAVLIGSVMFGIAHLGAPLSIPILTAVGVGLAYARAASGGLALPILLHFLHNLSVILLNMVN